MENPVAEISHVIHLLTQSTPSVQRQTIEKYYTPSASLIHPFCRTGSFGGSRWLVIWIFRFYKIMSPHIDLKIFRIFVIPFYVAPVTLTSVLTLTTSQGGTPSAATPVTDYSDTDSYSSARRPLDLYEIARPADHGLADLESPSRPTLYYIAAQNDLYETSEFIKFVVPFGVGSTLVLLWQCFATIFSVVGAVVLWPISFAEEAGMLPVAEKGNIQDEGHREGLLWRLARRKHK
ncbi:predicted protein [Uncinocarpus reesii 1704]|uniref:SigF-like NTF2-like domain-containing protein n=1 Tax=Uncinocarpus reesii (strain UAMH 1704) TaxID=336963 RepID=C4JNI0_UNCRE|nr:uncharacterized protein UREG_02978 [Uncinocarpus reesii 1704]EEP78133.1 predicted protein [Uncinocarpus reesii 1704]